MDELRNSSLKQSFGGLIRTLTTLEQIDNVRGIIHQLQLDDEVMSFIVLRLISKEDSIRSYFPRESMNNIPPGGGF